LDSRTACRASTSPKREALLRDLHAQGIVKTVEIVEHADGSGEFDDLPVVEVAAEFGPEFIVNRVSISGHALGKP